MFNLPSCLFADFEAVISLSICEYLVTAAIKPIAGKRENGFDKFSGVRFMSSDAPLYSRNIGKETESKPTEPMNYPAASGGEFNPE
jgi:hypothetical protein